MFVSSSMLYVHDVGGYNAKPHSTATSLEYFVYWVTNIVNISLLILIFLNTCNVFLACRDPWLSTYGQLHVQIKLFEN